MRYRWIVLTVMMFGLMAGPLSGPGAKEIGHEIEAHDEDRARDALERGEILPLERVMALLRAAVPGEISGVELEREGRRWVYEFKVIAPSGRMIEVRIDAKTGDVIGRETE
jgi:uncharacterized membrane protein YkoI